MVPSANHNLDLFKRSRFVDVENKSILLLELFPLSNRRNSSPCVVNINSSGIFISLDTSGIGWGIPSFCLYRRIHLLMVLIGGIIPAAPWLIFITADDIIC